MPAIFSYLLISVALMALGCAWGRRQTAQAVHPKRLGGEDATKALVLAGPSSYSALGVSIGSTVRVAPIDDDTAAVEVLDASGVAVTSIATDHVLTARGWSGDELVLRVGDSGDGCGRAWPLAPGMAGWQLHLADVSGQVLHCYGAPTASLAEDLARLDARLHASALACAS